MRSRRLILVLLALLSCLALRIWVVVHPVWWLWGLDALSDVPPALGIAGLLLFAAAAIPAVGAALMRTIQTASEHRGSALAAALVAFSVVLVTLSTTHALHGDAQVYLSTLEKGLRAAGAAHREPLPQFLVTALHRLLVEPLGGSPSLTFRIWGLLTGLLFLSLTIELAARLSDTVRGRTILTAAIVCGGTWPLFAGHAELYGFALVAIVALVFTGLRWIDGRGRLLWVGVSYAVAGLCHAQLAFMAPGLLLLVREQWQRGDRRAALSALAIVPVLVLTTLVALDYPFGDLSRELHRADALLPPLGEMGGRTAYGIFSWVHAVELLNVSFLLSPLLFFLLPLAISSHRGGRSGGRSEALKLHFLAAIALGPVLFAVAANPALGMVRDWDLYALAVVLATLCVAARAVRQIELPGGHGRPSDSDLKPSATKNKHEAATGKREGRGGARLSFTGRLGSTADALVGMLFLTGLLHALSWMYANHTEAYAESRLRRIVSNPALFGPVSRGEVWRYVAFAAARDGALVETAQAYLEAIRADPKEAIPYRQFAALALQGAMARGHAASEGLAAYHETLASGPYGKAEAHLGGLIAAIQVGQDSLSVAEGRALLATSPDQPEYQAIWGDLARRAGEVEEAEAWYRRALEQDADQVRALLGSACLAGMRGDRETMVALSRRASAARPFSTQGQQFALLLDQPEALTPLRCRAMFFFR